MPLVHAREAQDRVAAHAEGRGDPRAVHRGAQQEAFDVLAGSSKYCGLPSSSLRSKR
jgi:hypothetical protein